MPPNSSSSYSRFTVRSVSNNFSRHFADAKGLVALSPTTSQRETVDDFTESLSSESDSPHHPSDAGSVLALGVDERHSIRAASHSGHNLRKDISLGGSRASRTQVVIVVGPPGYAIYNLRFPGHLLVDSIGKSSIVVVNQAKWRCKALLIQHSIVVA